MTEIIRRILMVSGALLLLFGASAVFADGSYQQTKDGKTSVWNNEPKPGDEATWSGNRDRDGYASGFGTLTWYTGQKQTVRHFGIPVTTSRIFARYFGNMVRGKLNGPVNVHTKEKTDYAIFVEGVRTTRWAGGPAPSWKVTQEPTRLSKPDAVAATTVVAKRSTIVEPEAPAEGPAGQKPEVRSEKPAVVEQKTDISGPGRAAAKPPPTKKRQIEMENSLRSLIGPPSTLHAMPEAASSSPSKINPRLTKEAVVDLADAEARRRGYDPSGYQRTDVQYTAADGTWSLSYDQPAIEGAEEAGKHFSVTIDDKTKGTVFVLRK